MFYQSKRFRLYKYYQITLHRMKERRKQFSRDFKSVCYYYYYHICLNVYGLRLAKILKLCCYEK